MRYLGRGAALILLLNACANPTGLSDLRVGAGLTEVYSAAMSNLPVPANRLVRDEATWTVLWDSLQAVEVQPPVDFTAEELLVARLGTRPSGGYLIHIDSLQDAGTQRTAFVTTYRPGSGCAVATVRTQPVHVVATPARDTPITFLERTRTYSCE